MPGREREENNNPHRIHKVIEIPNLRLEFMFLEEARTFYSNSIIFLFFLGLSQLF